MIPSPRVRLVTTPAPVGGVAVAGADLSGVVLRFSYEDRDDAVDKVTVQLANPGLQLLDRPDLLGGAPWQVSWGVEGAMTRPRTMTVRTVRGVEVLTVEGHARHIAMDRIAVARVYRGLTRSQVMAEVAARHGYQGAFAQISPTAERFEAIHQVAETDARFLRRLAGLEDFTLSLDDDRLVIGPASALAEPTRVLTWRPGTSEGEVLALSVESNLALLVGQVELRGRDPREKRTVTATATRTPDEQRSVDRWFDWIDPETGHTRVQERVGVTLTHPTTVASPGAVARRAAATLRRLDADAVKLSIRIVGDATLRPRQVIEVRGASQRLSGRYYVRTAKHEISAEGYTTDLTVRRLVGGGGATLGGTRAGTARGPGPTGGAAAPARPPTAFDRIDPETGHTRSELR